MTSKRKLAAVIWIAIFMIAVQLSAVPALAHGGHPHARDSIATVSHDRAEGGAIQLNAAQANAERAEVVVEVTAVGVNVSRAPPCGTCNDGCCTSGFSCCVPAILSEAAVYIPIRLSGLEVLRPGTSMRTGIDPEALPKPPKSFT
jgi:hypothetical protein